MMEHSLKISKKLILPLSLVIIFDLLILGGVYLVGVTRNVPFGDITRDPGAVTGRIFIGMLSYMGIILWAATAAISYLGAILLYKINEASRFLLFSAFFTTILLFDDAFALHDEIIPRLLHIHEWPIYLVYLLLIILYLVYFGRYILTRTDYPILMGALLFFGSSIVLDVFFDEFPTLALQPLFEDGTKFIGISLWLLFFSLTVFKLFKPYLRAQEK
jgi:hypothetical protein